MKLKETIKNAILPREEFNVRFTVMMSYAVRTSDNDFVTYDNKTKKLMKCPSEFIIGKVPVYSIPVSIDKIKEGDIILMNNKNTFYIFKECTGDTIKCIDMNEGSIIEAIKIDSFIDSMIKNKSIRTICNLFNGDNNAINPMMFALAMGDSKKDFATMMMYQMMNNGDNKTGFNPMILALMNDNDESGENDTFTNMMLYNIAFPGMGGFDLDHMISPAQKKEK